MNKYLKKLLGKSVKSETIERRVFVRNSSFLYFYLVEETVFSFKREIKAEYITIMGGVKEKQSVRNTYTWYHLMDIALDNGYEEVSEEDVRIFGEYDQYKLW